MGCRTVEQKKKTHTHFDPDCKYTYMEYSCKISFLFIDLSFFFAEFLYKEELAFKIKSS